MPGLQGRKWQIVSIVTMILGVLFFQNCGDPLVIAPGGVKGSSVTESFTFMSGDFAPLAAAATEGLSLKGRALILRSLLGYTEVYAHLSGLQPNASYMAHVHNQPCNIESGGPHYKIDESVTEAIESNEIWMQVQSDASGVGKGYVKAVHLARPEAQSIVVHSNLNGARLACVDLRPEKNKSQKYGILQATADGAALGYTISGDGTFIRSSDGTSRVRIAALGLTVNTMYMGHIHAEPCSTGGGGHYKYNPNIVDALESNEFWIPLAADDTGAALSDLTFSHLARAEAQSYVIHDAVNPAVRIACLDFTGSGSAVSTPDGLKAGLVITGSAWLRRSSDGATQVGLDLEGLAPSTQYAAHVHALPCTVNGGGGHYKKDTTIATADSGNEIWPLIVSDASGRASTTVVVSDHMVRPDAQSIVIHNPADTSKRIMCVDL